MQPHEEFHSFVMDYTRYVGTARGALAFATAPGMRLFLSAVTRPGGASQ